MREKKAEEKQLAAYCHGEDTLSSPLWNKKGGEREREKQKGEKDEQLKCHKPKGNQILNLLYCFCFPFFFSSYLKRG